MITPNLSNAEIVIRGGSNPQRYAIIEDATGKCVNVVTWDAAAEPDWAPPAGFTAVQDDTREIDPPPPVIPATATKLQLRNALKAMGRWDAVRAAIQADADLQEEWELATEIDRGNPLVQAVAVAFGMDDAALDALFLAAAG